MYYINEFSVLSKRGEYVILLVQSTQSVVKVSKDLYVILAELLKTYPGIPIPRDALFFQKIKKSPVFHRLLKAMIISEDRKHFIPPFKRSGTLEKVYFHITMACNLSCTYCYAKKQLDAQNTMDISSAKMWMDELLRAGVHQFVLTGGEPTLHPNIAEILEHLFYKRSTHLITTTVLTNGTLLKEKMSILNYVDQMIVSMDVGDSALRRGLDRERLMDHLSGIPVEHKHKVIVRSVITRGEEHKIEEMRRMVEGMGLGYIAEPRLPNRIEDLNLLPDFKLLAHPYLTDRVLPTVCGACTSVISVLPDGSVYPCQNLNKPELKLTELNHKNWKAEIASSKVTRVFMDAGVDKISGCSSCSVRYFCGGGCRALSYNVYGVLDSRLDFLCEDLKESIIDRLSLTVFKEK